MVVELIIPIETIRGKLKNDGYYFRVCKGKQIVQHNPTQWKDTPARKAARERFVEKYGKKKTGTVSDRDIKAGKTEEEKRRV